MSDQHWASSGPGRVARGPLWPPGRFDPRGAFALRPRVSTSRTTPSRNVAAPCSRLARAFLAPSWHLPGTFLAPSWHARRSWSDRALVHRIELAQAVAWRLAHLDHVSDALPSLRARLVDALDLAADGDEKIAQLLLARALAIVSLRRLLQPVDQLLEKPDLWQQQQRPQDALQVRIHFVEERNAARVVCELAAHVAVFLVDAANLVIFGILEEDAQPIVGLRQVIKRVPRGGRLVADVGMLDARGSRQIEPHDAQHLVPNLAFEGLFRRAVGRSPASLREVRQLAAFLRDLPIRTAIGNGRLCQLAAPQRRPWCALRDDGELARPDAGQRRIKIGVHEVARLVVAVARRDPQTRTRRKQVADRTQVLRVDLVEEDLRGEAAHLVDRVQVLEHRIGGLQHVRHQRFADALFQPIEVEPPLGLFRLALELALDDV